MDFTINLESKKNKYLQLRINPMLLNTKLKLNLKEKQIFIIITIIFREN